MDLKLNHSWLSRAVGLRSFQLQNIAVRHVLLWFITLVTAGEAAWASCGQPAQVGVWTNRDGASQPYAIEVTMPGCEGKFFVVAMTKQSNGTLFRRAAVPGTLRGSTLIARVYTGGYVDNMEMKPVRINGQTVLQVAVRHESLDRKPDAFSQFTFERGLRMPEVKPYKRLGKETGRMIFAGLSDWDRDGHLDILTIERGTGDLMLYPGESKQGYSQAQPVKIGNGWNGYSPAGLADWDRDGHQDILVRHDATGDLFLYPGESKRAYSMQNRAQIGNGWGGHTVFGVGDWDRDGFPDILVRRDSDGELRLYPGDGQRGYSQQVPLAIGSNWRGHVPFGLADYDGDGRLDLLTLSPDGDLVLQPGEGRRAPLTVPAMRIASGWSNFNSFGAGDWDGDGKADLIVREWRSYRLLLFPGPGRRAALTSAAIQIGNGW